MPQQTTTSRASQLARDARDLAVHVEALKRHVEQIDRPLAHNAREAWLALRDLANTLDYYGESS